MIKDVLRHGLLGVLFFPKLQRVRHEISEIYGWELNQEEKERRKKAKEKEKQKKEQLLEIAQKRLEQLKEGEGLEPTPKKGVPLEERGKPGMEKESKEEQTGKGGMPK